jgi:hypothetical protein
VISKAERRRFYGHITGSTATKGLITNKDIILSMCLQRLRGAQLAVTDGHDVTQQSLSKVAELEAAVRAERAKVKELEKTLQAAELRTSSEQHHRARKSSLDRSSLKRFSYEEIDKATGSFAGENMLGEGGFGRVYRGVIDHTEVAVKLLNEEDLQGKDQFQREIEVHCRIRHPHVAMLLGTCIERRLCLVYDLMPNGSLEDRLLRAGGSAALTWQTRIRIATEVAVALLYLHSARPAPIIHR